MACSLRQLPADTEERITRITAQGELGRRIRDMGLVPGMSIKVIDKASPRDPVAIRTGGARISLCTEADYVEI